MRAYEGERFRRKSKLDVSLQAREAAASPSQSIVARSTTWSTTWSFPSQRRMVSRRENADVDGSLQSSKRRRRRDRPRHPPRRAHVARRIGTIRAALQVDTSYVARLRLSMHVRPPNDRAMARGRGFHDGGSARCTRHRCESGGAVSRRVVKIRPRL